MKKLSTNEDVMLREFREEDASLLAKYADNERVSVNLRDGFPKPYTLEQAKAFIGKAKTLQPQTIFAIEYMGQYVGNISLSVCSDIYRKSAEIGYFIAEPFWNKGIATKAVKLITDFGFKHLDIVRIHTGVFNFNIASQKVLEKCGFTKEGVFEKALYREGQFYNEIRYAKIKTH